MDVCKFCHFEFDGSLHRCENGSVYDDDCNVIDSTYCGNAYCPACGSCQGRTDVTVETQANAAVMRAIFEHTPFCWVRRDGIWGQVTVHYADRLPKGFR